ncbi:MAG: ABC transporter substrate-binding protein [Candidatus Bathyarchaeia archaeon]
MLEPLNVINDSIEQKIKEWVVDKFFDTLVEFAPPWLKGPAKVAKWIIDHTDIETIVEDYQVVKKSEHWPNPVGTIVIGPDNKEWKITQYTDKEPGGLTQGDLLTLTQTQNRKSCRRAYSAYYVNTLKLYYHRIIIKTFLGNIPIPIKFYNCSGVEVGTLDVGDIEYSIKRGLVQDQYGSPMWMFYEMFFGEMNSDIWDTGNPEDAWILSSLIDNVCEINGDDVILNMAGDLQGDAVLYILSGPWASILDKEWCISKGCWDGELFSDDGRYTGSVAENGIPDWFESWRHCIAFGYVSPIQSIKPENYAGTGPYRVVVASAAQNLVVLRRNPNYWRGWPAPFYIDTATGELVRLPGYLEYIDIEYIADWTTRKTAFLACQLDVCAVPRANMMELLDPNDPARMEPLYPEIKTIKNISPVLSVYAMFFTFTVNPMSPFIYTGRFPDGIPPDFFNNTHVRRAFAYAFNHTKVLKEVWQYEAICRETPSIYGLIPDYYTKRPDPPWTYDRSLDHIKAELQQAYFTQDGETKSVWDWGGFHLKLCFWYDWFPIYEDIVEAFWEINSMYGKDFIIDIDVVDWSTYLSLIEYMEMPAYVMSWKVDYPDIDNLYRPFMHSCGDFAYFQNYTAWNGWCGTLGPRTGLNKDQLIDIAVITPDGPERATYYADLEDIYIADCPSFPIAQPSERKWIKYWVKGWYYNPLSPDYYYYMYKEQACWADVTGPTVGIPDGVCNMRDIGYIARHFGARAPDPAATPPYDPRWAPGTYGCGGSDVYGDRKIDMRDIGYACRHFGHTTQP